jgi:ABC-2 type transport system permease protein
MKQFISFVKKEFYHIFRDRRTVMVLIVMPVIQMLLFGFALTTEVKNTPVAVFDPSKDISTRRIVEQLNANEYFTLVEELSSPGDIRRVFSEGKASLAVVFSENFHAGMMHTGEASIQLIADATDPNQARTFVAYALNIINRWKMENGSASGASNTGIRIEQRMLYNPQVRGAYNFVPGVMGLVLMLVCAMMTSVSIVREKETGTMELLLVSPVNPLHILLAKVTPYFVLAIVDLAIILALSVSVLGVPVAGSLFLLIAMALMFILSALSLGLLVSGIVHTQVAAMLITGVGLMLPTIILSGLIFPIESMPAILQWISAILPVRWFIAAVRKIMIQGVDIAFVAKEFAILAGMTVLLIFASYKKFAVRIKL